MNKQKFTELAKTLWSKGPSYPRLDYYEFIMAQALKEFEGIDINELLIDNEYEHPELTKIETSDNLKKYDPNNDELINSIFNDSTFSFLKNYAENKKD